MATMWVSVDEATNDTFLGSNTKAKTRFFLSLGKEMNENELVRRAVIRLVETTHFRPVLSNIDFKILTFEFLKTTCGVVWCVFLSRKDYL
jgi:hypothetical protein